MDRLPKYVSQQVILRLSEHLSHAELTLARIKRARTAEGSEYVSGITKYWSHYASAIRDMAEKERRLTE